VTGRTRWDALAEELSGETSKPYRPEPGSNPAVDGFNQQVRKTSSEISVLVTVGGRMIPAANISMNWSVDADYELMRLGVLSAEDVRRQPTKVTGSFVTTDDAGYQLSGKELVILVKRGDEVVKFLAYVNTTKWNLSPSTCEVTFVGTQVG